MLVHIFARMINKAMSINGKLKSKKCRCCKLGFTPWNSLQVCCTPLCAIEYTKNKQETKLRADINRADKIKRADTRKKKQKFYDNDRPLQLKLTQAVVNKYVRLRDRGLICISCDKPDNGQHQRHASHLKSVGSNSALRFNLWNIHASCSKCNKDLSGNIGEYIPRLIKKIGQDKYDWLQTQNHTVKYDIEYLHRLRKVFSKRCRMLERRV